MAGSFFLEGLLAVLNLNNLEPLLLFKLLLNVTDLGWTGPFYVFAFILWVVVFPIIVFHYLSKDFPKLRKSRFTMAAVPIALSLIILIEEYHQGTLLGVKDSKYTYNLASALSNGIYRRTHINFLVHGITKFEQLSPKEWAASRLLPTVDMKKPILIVLVESLGQYKDARLLNDLLNVFKMDSHFQVQERGQVSYSGSTINGEFRELCGERMVTFSSTNPKPKWGCLLLDRLNEQGYDISTFHGFRAAFYERSQWYKPLGLKKSYFLEDIFAEEKNAKLSDYPFRGVTDESVEQFMEKKALGASSAAPLMFYWLTLDSHIPVPDEKTEGISYQCPSGLDDMICNLQKVIFKQFSLVRNFALNTPQDWQILLVGDHMPPFIGQGLRSNFENHLVPFFLIEKKSGGGQSPPRQVAGRSVELLQ